MLIAEVFARSSNEKKNQSESQEAKDHLFMSADVVSLVSTDQNWWNQWSKASAQGAVGLPRRHCSVSWLERPWQAAAGKKILMNVIEKRKCTVLSWYSPFVEGGGGGGTRRNFPKQRQAEVWLARSPTVWRRKKGFALRVLLSGWNSPPQRLDDRSHQTWIFALWRARVLSKLKKARKSEVCLAEEERQNILAAA